MTRIKDSSGNDCTEFLKAYDFIDASLAHDNISYFGHKDLFSNLTFGQALRQKYSYICNYNNNTVFLKVLVNPKCVFQIVDEIHPQSKAYKNLGKNLIADFYNLSIDKNCYCGYVFCFNDVGNVKYYYISAKSMYDFITHNPDATKITWEDMVSYGVCAIAPYTSSGKLRFRKLFDALEIGE